MRRRAGRGGSAVRPPARFVAVGGVGAVPPESVRDFVADGVEIVVVHAAGELRAFANRCPHQGNRLSRARLVDGCVVCPWHGWRFDARTGRARWPEGYERLVRYPVAVRDGQILVGLD